MISSIPSKSSLAYEAIKLEIDAHADDGANMPMLLKVNVFHA